jgi:hypothetical protein
VSLCMHELVKVLERLSASQVATRNVSVDPVLEVRRPLVDPVAHLQPGALEAMSVTLARETQAKLGYGASLKASGVPGRRSSAPADGKGGPAGAQASFPTSKKQQSLDDDSDWVRQHDGQENPWENGRKRAQSTVTTGNLRRLQPVHAPAPSQSNLIATAVKTANLATQFAHEGMHAEAEGNAPGRACSAV